MNEELKACPFCGGEAESLPDEGSARCSYVHCYLHRTWLGEKLWRGRPIEDALNDKLDAARNLITELRALEAFVTTYADNYVDGLSPGFPRKFLEVYPGYLYRAEKAREKWEELK